MFEMWFDGGNIVPINDLIDQLSPGIISFQGRRTGGSRWVGTEHGFAPYPCWNTIDWKPGETPKEGAGTSHRQYLVSGGMRCLHLPPGLVLEQRQRQPHPQPG